MHSEYTQKAKLSTLLVSAAMLTSLLSGCSGTNAPSPTEVVSSETSAGAGAQEHICDHSDPQFLKALTQDPDHPALSCLPEELLAEVPCTSIRLFGDNILLIEEHYEGWEGDFEGAYEEDFEEAALSDELSDDAPVDWYEGDSAGGSSGFSFDFTIYDPWCNELGETLHLPDSQYSQYQILGDRLLLTGYDSSTALLLDSDLQTIGEYDVAHLQEISSMTLTSSADGKTAFAYAYDLPGLIQVELSDLSWEYYPLDLYNVTPETLTSDGRYLIASAVTQDTLRRSVVLFDTETHTIVSSAEGNLGYGSSASTDGFLQSWDIYNDVWCYQSFTGETNWYYCPDAVGAALLDDDHILFRSVHTDYDTDEEYSNYQYCTIDGQTIAAFRFDNGCFTDQQSYIQFSEYACLADCDRLIFLVSTFDENGNPNTPQLMVWDLTAGDTTSDASASVRTYSSLEELREDINFEVGSEFVPSLIEDAKSYDWGELSDCQDRLNALEDRYGISIYFGPEVPETISEYTVSQENDPDTISGVLDIFEEQLSLYPDNFFRQLAFGSTNEICFYLSGHLTPTSDYVDFDPAAYVTEIDGRMIMVLDTLYGWDMCYTLNHELSHMIDRRLSYLSMYRSDCLFSDSTWASYNPEAFDYRYDYVGYENNHEYEIYSEWFIDAYGMTYPTEDRAEIFGYAMDAYHSNEDWREVFNEDSMIYEKLGYYAQCIRDGFDTTDWPEILPWEHYLRLENDAM